MSSFLAYTCVRKGQETVETPARLEALDKLPDNLKDMVFESTPQEFEDNIPMATKDEARLVRMGITFEMDRIRKTIRTLTAATWQKVEHRIEFYTENTVPKSSLQIQKRYSVWVLCPKRDGFTCTACQFPGTREKVYETHCEPNVRKFETALVHVINEHRDSICAFHNQSLNINALKFKLGTWESKLRTCKIYCDSESRANHNTNSRNILESQYKAMHLHTWLSNFHVSAPEDVGVVIRKWNKKLRSGALDYIKYKNLVSLTATYVKKAYGPLTTRRSILGLVEHLVMIPSKETQRDLIAKNLTDLSELGVSQMPFVHSKQYRIDVQDDGTFYLLMCGNREFTDAPLPVEGPSDPNLNGVKGRGNVLFDWFEPMQSGGGIKKTKSKRKKDEQNREPKNALQVAAAREEKRQKNVDNRKFETIDRTLSDGMHITILQNRGNRCFGCVVVQAADQHRQLSCDEVCRRAQEVAAELKVDALPCVVSDPQTYKRWVEKFPKDAPPVLYRITLYDGKFLLVPECLYEEIPPKHTPLLLTVEGKKFSHIELITTPLLDLFAILSQQNETMLCDVFTINIQNEPAPGASEISQKMEASVEDLESIDCQDEDRVCEAKYPSEPIDVDLEGEEVDIEDLLITPIPNKTDIPFEIGKIEEEVKNVLKEIPVEHRYVNGSDFKPNCGPTLSEAAKNIGFEKLIPNGWWWHAGDSAALSWMSGDDLQFRPDFGAISRDVGFWNAAANIIGEGTALMYYIAQLKIENEFFANLAAMKEQELCELSDYLDTYDIDMVRLSREYAPGNFLPSWVFPLRAFSGTQQGFTAWVNGQSKTKSVVSAIAAAFDSLASFASAQFGGANISTTDSFRRLRANIVDVQAQGVSLPKARKVEEEALKHQGNYINIDKRSHKFNRRIFRHGETIFQYKFAPVWKEVDDWAEVVPIPRVAADMFDDRSGILQATALKVTDCHFALVKEYNHVERRRAVLSVLDIVKRIYIRRSLYDSYEDDGVDRWHKYDISEYHNLLNKTHREILTDLLFHPLEHLKMVLALWIHQDCSGYVVKTNAYVVVENLALDVNNLIQGVPKEKLDEFYLAKVNEHYKVYNINPGAANVYTQAIRKLAVQIDDAFGDPDRYISLSHATAHYATTVHLSVIERTQKLNINNKNDC